MVVFRDALGTRNQRLLDTCAAGQPLGVQGQGRRDDFPRATATAAFSAQKEQGRAAVGHMRRRAATIGVLFG